MKWMNLKNIIWSKRVRHKRVYIIRLHSQESLEHASLIFELTLHLLLIQTECFPADDFLSFSLSLTCPSLPSSLYSALPLPGILPWLMPPPSLPTTPQASLKGLASQSTALSTPFHCPSLSKDLSSSDKTRTPGDACPVKEGCPLSTTSLVVESLDRGGGWWGGGHLPEWQQTGQLNPWPTI